MQVRSNHAHTQDVFRRANERLLAAVEDRVDVTKQIPFLCECLDPSCRDTVDLSVEQFRNLKEHDGRFVMVTGHPALRGERVVRVQGDVTIVQDDG
jgi:hypothetical protein